MTLCCHHGRLTDECYCAAPEWSCALPNMQAQSTTPVRWTPATGSATSGPQMPCPPVIGLLHESKRTIPLPVSPNFACSRARPRNPPLTWTMLLCAPLSSWSSGAAAQHGQGTPYIPFCITVYVDHNKSSTQVPNSPPRKLLIPYSVQKILRIPPVKLPCVDAVSPRGIQVNHHNK